MSLNVPGLRSAAMIAMLVVLGGCAPRVELFRTDDLHAANEVQALLRARAIPVVRRPTKEGVALSVSDGDFPAAAAALREAGLPRQRRARLADALGKKGILPTPLEDNARYVHALEQEIEAAVLEIEGVVAARARIVPLERPAPGAPVVLPSASLLVTHRADVDLSGLVPGIVQLVKNGVPGLAGEDDRRVAVVLVAEPLRAAFPAAAHARREQPLIAYVLPTLLAAGSGFALGWFSRPLLARRRAANDQAQSSRHAP